MFKRSRLLPNFVCGLAAVMVVLALSSPAAAQTTYTWDGLKNGSLADSGGTWDATTYNWSTTAGSADVQWQNNNNAVFGSGTPGGGSYTVTLGGSVAPAGITFNNPGYTINPDASDLYGLTVGGGGITANASAAINAPVVLGAAQTWTAAAGQQLTVGGNISGNGSSGLTVSGPGIVALSGANTYAGGTTIAGGGTLELAATSAISPNSIYTVNSINGLVFGTGVTAGTIAGLSGTPGGVGGTGGISLTNLGGQPVALTIGANNASATITGTAGGSGSLTKIGTGLQCFYGWNGGVWITPLPSGLTTVSVGTLEVQCWADNLAGPVSIAPGATFMANIGYALTPDANETISGSGTLLITGGQLYLSAYPSYISMGAGGLIDIENGGSISGNFHAQQFAANKASMKVASGATMDLFAQDLTVDALNGSGTVTDGYYPGYQNTLYVGVAGGSGTFSGIIQGAQGGDGATGRVGVTKQGTGIEVLNGNNTYAGSTTVTAGTLAINGQLPASPVTVTGGVLSGTGSFGNLIHVANGGALSPGFVAGAGTLNAVNVALDSGSTLDYALVAPASPGNGFLEVTGTLSLPISGVTVDLTGASPALGTYPLIGYGSLSGGVAALSLGSPLPAGDAARFINVDNVIDLVISSTSGGTNGQWAVNSGGSWSTPSNWSGGVPGSGQDTAVFGTVLTSGTANVILDASRSLASLGFNTAGANSYVISASNGSTLTLSGASGTATLSDSGGNHTIAAPITLGSNLSVTAAPGSMLTVSGAIGETYVGTALSLSGGGTLVLSGVNAYSGPTTIAAGTLQVGNAAALQNSTAVLSGGYLDLSPLAGATATLGGLSGAGNLPIAAGTLAVGNNGAGTTYSGNLGGGGALAKIGGGTLVLTGAGNSYGGGTTIYNGVLQIGDGAANAGSLPGSVVINSATPGALTFNLPAAASLNSTGNISGSGGGGLTVSSGAVTLYGNNSYAGATTISGAGTLELGAQAAIAPNSAFTNNVNNGLLFGPGVTIVTLGSLSGSGFLYTSTIYQQGVTLTVGGNGDSTTYSGPINAGYGGSLTKTGSGTMTLSGGDNYGLLVSVTGGTLVLATVNGYHPDSSIGGVSAGATLQLGYGGTQVYGGVNNMNGTFDYNGFNQGLVGLNGTGTVTNNAVSTTSMLTFGSIYSGAGGVGDPRAYTDTFGGNIVDGNGTMVLTVSAFNGGGLTLTGTGNAYSGGTTIAYGTLQIGDGSTGPGSLPGNVVISSTTPGALTFNTPAGMSVAVSGNISGNGSGGLAVGGSGVVTLSGSNSYTGGTTIGGGTLVLATTAAAPPNSNYTVNANNGLVFGTGLNALTIGGLFGTGGGITGSTLGAITLTSADGQPVALTVGANDASGSYGGALNGLGSLTKIGTGLQSIGVNPPGVWLQSLSYSGLTTVSAGTLEMLSSWTWLGAVSIAPGATFQISPNGWVATSNPTTAISGSGTFLITAANGGGMTLVYPGHISMGAGGLIDIESGELNEDGAGVNWNSNLASMKVASGCTFDIYGQSAIIDALNGSGTVRNGYNNFDNTLYVGVANGSGTFSGTIAGAGGADGAAGVLYLTKEGTGIEVLSGNNTYSGSTAVTGGTLQIGNGTSGEGLASQSVVMSNGATLAFNHADSLSYGGAISGSGQLVKLGTGVLDLSGTSTYSGPTTISAGTVELDGNGNNLPTATALTIASSGVLDLAGVPQTVGSLSGSAGAIITNHYSPDYPSTLTVAPSSGSTTFAGNIIGNDALALSGSGELTLSGTNTYYGGTTVSGGTLDIAAPSALAGSGLVTIAAGGRLVSGSGAGIGALLAASSPVGSDAVALSAAAIPATLGGPESGYEDMATLGGAPPLSQGGGGSAVGGTAAAVPEPAAVVLLIVAAVCCLALWRAAPSRFPAGRS